MRAGRMRQIAAASIVLAAASFARTPQDAASPVVTISAEELERHSSSRSLADLLTKLPCTPQTVPTFIRPATPAPSAKGALTCVAPADIRMVEVHRIHNETRRQFGSQPLVWDPTLAAAAQAYAGQLARTGRLVHAPRAGRGAARENLSQGLLNWGTQPLIGNWLRERPLFRPGTYPNVSSTGHWADVSHYTQMVWPSTVNLGCGIVDGSGSRWLVCRYTPGGNKDGFYLTPASAAPRR